MKECFALDKNGDCRALKKKKCEKCHFYRNDLNKYQIEMDIIKYKPEGKKNEF